MSAWLNGFIGIASGLGIGMGVLHFAPSDVALCLVASNIGGLVALLLTLQLEWKPWIKRHVLNRSRRTWPFFLCVYYGITLWLAPPVRELRAFLWMLVPMALSNGFTILAFGPIQDRLVARHQRLSRAQSR